MGPIAPFRNNLTYLLTSSFHSSIKHRNLYCLLAEAFLGSSTDIVVNDLDVASHRRIVVPVEVVHSDHERQEDRYKHHHKLHHVLDTITDHDILA